jgi:hypothetical protein
MDMDRQAKGTLIRDLNLKSSKLMHQYQNNEFLRMNFVNILLDSALLFNGAV